MFARGQSLTNDPPSAGTSVPPLLRMVRTMGIRLIAWAKTCGDYYAAAAAYEHLSALSDAELTQRGLSRATLARDVCAAFDCHEN